MFAIPFTTLKRSLGTEDTKWWSVSGVICPILLQTSLKVGKSTGSSLLHFALQNAPRILYWRQVGTAGRPVKYPYPLPPQPGLCNVCRMWFCIVLFEICMDVPGKDVFLKASILCSKISMYFSALMVPSQKCKLPCQGHWHNPIPWQTLAFGLVAGNSLDDPFLLWSGAHGVHSSQKYLKYWFIWPQYHVSTVWWSHPRCLRAQRSRRRFWTLLT